MFKEKKYEFCTQTPEAAEKPASEPQVGLNVRRGRYKYGTPY
jgi:hypothetical protein